jgi:hypothetical protein
MLNLTQHEIRLVTPNGEFSFPPSGTASPAWKPSKPLSAQCPITGAADCAARKGHDQRWHAPGRHGACLVSSMVLEACPGRAGVFAPDSGKTAIRNEKGHVVAVTQLVAA